METVFFKPLKKELFVDFCEGDDAVTAERYGGTLEMLAAAHSSQKAWLAVPSRFSPTKPGPILPTGTYKLRSYGREVIERPSGCHLARSCFACLTPKKQLAGKRYERRSQETSCHLLTTDTYQ